jgi:CHAT domain-containing protein
MRDLTSKWGKTVSLDKISEDTVQALEDALSADLSADEREKISKILQKALIKSVEQATKSHRAATVVCCGPEADLAHKIAEEMSLANKALIANLMAMR